MAYDNIVNKKHKHLTDEGLVLYYINNMKLKKIVTSRMFFVIVVTTVFFFANLVLIPLHEKGLDEANQWMIAKTASITELPSILATEGHPPLWYLLLMIPAKLGFSHIASNVICLLIMSLSVFLIARYAPFRRITIIAVVLGVTCFYFSPVVVRNYCLVAIGIVLCALTYKKRFKHPIRYMLALALLFQSHLIMAGLGGALMLVYAWEIFRDPKNKQKNLKYLLIPFTSALIFLLCIVGAIGTYGSFATERHGIGGIIEYVLSLDNKLWGNIIPTKGVVLILLCWLGVLLWYKNRVALFIFAVGTVWHFIIMGVIYDLDKPMISAMIIWNIFIVVWISYLDHSRKKLYMQNSKLEIIKFFLIIPRAPELILGIIVALSIPNTLVSAVEDAKYPFGRSKEIATYINDNLPEDSMIIVGEGHVYAEGVLIYLESAKIWDAITEETLDYLIFDKDSRNPLDVDNLKYNIDTLFCSMNNVYYLDLVWAENRQDGEIKNFLDDHEKIYEKTSDIMISSHLSNNPAHFAIYKISTKPTCE